MQNNELNNINNKFLQKFNYYFEYINTQINADILKVSKEYAIKYASTIFDDDDKQDFLKILELEIERIILAQQEVIHLMIKNEITKPLVKSYHEILHVVQSDTAYEVKETVERLFLGIIKLANESMPNNDILRDTLIQVKESTSELIEEMAVKLSECEHTNEQI